MSVRRIFHVMMGVVLCLLMQLPPFVMDAAMAHHAPVSAAFTKAMSPSIMQHHGMMMAGSERGELSSSASSSRMLSNTPQRGMPCCASHHTVCEAAFLPQSEQAQSPLMGQKMVLFHQWQFVPRSPTILPWRPPRQVAV